MKTVIRVVLVVSVIYGIMYGKEYVRNNNSCPTYATHVAVFENKIKVFKHTRGNKDGNCYYEQHVETVEYTSQVEKNKILRKYKNLR